MAPSLLGPTRPMGPRVLVDDDPYLIVLTLRPRGPRPRAVRRLVGTAIPRDFAEQQEKYPREAARLDPEGWQLPWADEHSKRPHW